MFKKSMYGFIIIVLTCVGCAKSTDDLIIELDSSNSRTRMLTMTKLMGRRKDPETSQKLVVLLDGDNERLIFLATQILGSLADTTAIHPLGRMIDHTNPNIRELAVWSLGTIGHESGWPYVEKALGDSVSGVRHAAITALGHLRYAPATKQIFRMFRDEADSVRAAAVQALYRYRTVENADVMAVDFTVPVRDHSELVRYVTIQALGWEAPGGYPDSTVAGELLIEALKDQGKYVRVEAIYSLSKNKYKPAVPYLKKMYDLATVEEEYAIAEAIKNITGEDFPVFDEE